MNPDGIEIKKTADKKDEILIILDGKECSREEMEALNPKDIESVDFLKDAVSTSLFGETGKNCVLLIKTRNGKTAEPAFEVVEKHPEYKGGMPELMNFVAQSIRYPKEAQELGLSGRVIVSFVIEKDGSVSEVKAENNSAKPKKEDYTTSDVTVNGYGSTDKDEAKPTFEEMDAAAKILENEAIRVVKLTNGSWTPGEHKGNKVRVRFHIPITFRLS